MYTQTDGRTTRKRNASSGVLSATDRKNKIAKMESKKTQSSADRAEASKLKSKLKESTVKYLSFVKNYASSSKISCTSLIMWLK